MSEVILGAKFGRLQARVERLAAFARVFARCPVCCGVRKCKPSCDAERSIMRQAALLRGRIRDMVEARRALYGEEGAA